MYISFSQNSCSEYISYISDVQYLYIQYHRYIAARRGKMKEERSAFLIQMIEHIGHSYYQLRCVRKLKKQLFLLLQEVRSLTTGS